MSLNILSGHKIKGTVVLVQKNVPGGATDVPHTSFLGQSVSFRLISATKADNSTGKGIVGNAAYLDGVINNLPTLAPGQSAFNIYFDHDSNFGIPGAFYINNFITTEFYLVSLTLEGVPHQGSLHFHCNSWIYNANKYQTDRIFFVNNTYRPGKTPAPLVYYREEELKTLRGDGTGERQEWERIYDYDFYNDLADPDTNDSLARPVLGGSTTYPYPRRGRTGRPPTKKDPNTESRSPIFYIPRDELLGFVQSPDFFAYGLKSISEVELPALESAFARNLSPHEFHSFEDVHDLFEEGIKLPLDVISQISHEPVLEKLVTTDGQQMKFPKPKVIQVNKSAWMTDEEFAREIIAGVNPALIRCLHRPEQFPPKSNLDSGSYGDHTSTITKEHIEPNLDGLTVEEAIEKKKLFLLDDHDAIMPYLRKINSTSSKAYATRTILFLKDDGTLRPLAIELSLPNPRGDHFGAVSNVYLPDIADSLGSQTPKQP